MGHALSGLISYNILLRMAWPQSSADCSDIAQMVSMSPQQRLEQEKSKFLFSKLTVSPQAQPVAFQPFLKVVTTTRLEWPVEEI